MSMYDVPMWQHFIFAALATGGFSIFFNVERKILPFASVVGGIGWLIFVEGSLKFENPLIFSFIPAAFVSLSAEFLARKLKQPAIIIVIPGILPLVPGLGLYNTVYYIIQKQYEQATTAGTRAVIMSVGIALGILVMSSLSKVLNLYQLKRAFLRNDAFKYENWVNLGKNRTRNRFILDRKEMNESLNSLNLEIDENDKTSHGKMERSKTEDFAVDKNSLENTCSSHCNCDSDDLCSEDGQAKDDICDNFHKDESDKVNLENTNEYTLIKKDSKNDKKN